MMDDLEYKLKRAEHWLLSRNIKYNGESLREQEQFPYITSDIQYVEKVWGGEVIICKEPHAAKIMVLNADGQVSLHWHEDKSETFILIEGAMIIETIDITTGKKQEIELLSKFSSVTLPPRVPHTFYALPWLEDENEGRPTIFIEASTEDKASDSYRIYPSSRKESIDSR